MSTKQIGEERKKSATKTSFNLSKVRFTSISRLELQKKFCFAAVVDLGKPFCFFLDQRVVLLHTDTKTKKNKQIKNIHMYPNAGLHIALQPQSCDGATDLQEIVDGFD